MGFFMSTESQIENPKEFVEKAIDADKLVVFSKTYLPYASKAKKLLTTIGAVFKVYELNSLGEPRNGTLLCLGLFQYTQTSNFRISVHRPRPTISQDNQW